MASKTTFMGLTLPGYTDSAEIAVLNNNFTLIDTYIKNLSDKVAALEKFHPAAASAVSTEGAQEEVSHV